MPVYFGIAQGLLALALTVAGFTFSALAQHQTSTSARHWRRRLARLPFRCIVVGV